MRPTNESQRNESSNASDGASKKSSNMGCFIAFLVVATITICSFLFMNKDRSGDSQQEVIVNRMIMEDGEVYTVEEWMELKLETLATVDSCMSALIVARDSLILGIIDKGGDVKAEMDNSVEITVEVMELLFLRKQEVQAQIEKAMQVYELSDEEILERLHEQLPGNFKLHDGDGKGMPDWGDDEMEEKAEEILEGMRVV